jgi:hypothetical protein
MVSEQWIRETREYFLEFLRATKFPEFSEQGDRGPEVEYPEWLIMLIGVVAVKCKEKTYVGIHRLSRHYWRALCGKEIRVAPLSESRWRARLKKSAWRREGVQATGIKSFLRHTCEEVVRADKLRVHARGPVWHRKQQAQGIIPKGLHGLDTDGTWSYSRSDGWVYGHGTFCLVACRTRMLGPSSGCATVATKRSGGGWRPGN